MKTTMLRHVTHVRPFRRVTNPFKWALTSSLYNRAISLAPRVVNVHSRVQHPAVEDMVSRLDDPTIDVLEQLRRERQMNKLSNRMNQFHTYFKTQFNAIYQLSDGSFEKQRLSLHDFLQLIDDLIHHLTMHHTIEERVLFPVLGTRMPQFSEEETSGEHIESHRKIHDGLDKLSVLTKKWTSEPSAYSPSELKECLDGFRQVLFRHLDDEVSDLRGDNLVKYFSPEEVEALPL